MNLEILTTPGEKILELGGGNCPKFRPNVDCRNSFDAEGNPTVDFTASFEEPLPITSEEWDGVFCQFALEHVTYRKVPQFLKEVYRILKPGGRLCFITPNTMAQLSWIQQNQNGWDDKPFFESASEILFGSQDYSDNTHKSFWSPEIAQKLFSEAGFTDIKIDPYGVRLTDMVTQATRPTVKKELESYITTQPIGIKEDGITPDYKPLLTDEVSDVERMIRDAEKSLQNRVESLQVSSLVPLPQNAPEANVARLNAIGRVEPEAFSEEESKKRATQFDSDYFNGGKRIGGYVREGYKDFDTNENIARNILRLRPSSVIELGCGRGYVLKRLQDVDMPAIGFDISKYAYMTRVASGIGLQDICNPVQPWVSSYYDLCFSVNLLEHIPEQHLPFIFKEMQRVCKRGLHGILFSEPDNDQTIVTIRPKEWWIEQFAIHAPGFPVEIVNADELKSGAIPPEVFQDGGKIKLHLGPAWTMFRRGWHNIDIMDLYQFAQSHGYNFRQMDLRGILPYDTGTVDLIFAHHLLQQLSYKEGLALLRECRRVMKPDGRCGMRIVVPNGEFLNRIYRQTKAYEVIEKGRPGAAETEGLSYFDEMSEECKAAKTSAQKLHALLYPSGTQSVYDMETLESMLTDAGFEAHPSEFRFGKEPAFRQILSETTEMDFGGNSMFMDAVPAIGG